MNPQAMYLHGNALQDYYNGETTAQIIIRRDDGFETTLPVSIFFRTQIEFFPIEVLALKHCYGHVLDIGAGSGYHSLVLQTEGLKVTAIDICSQSVNIMKKSGVRDVYCKDIMHLNAGQFDTLLILGHGIGMVESIKGLKNFLSHKHQIVKQGGQIILNSLDVSRTTDQHNLKYHEANRNMGRYIGEIRMQFEYKGQKGPFFKWLHVDPKNLTELAKRTNWNSEIIHEEKNGEYLACLTPQWAKKYT
jgi:2-polyprenyl-3-methyl-5-hydroxy-6-metoxy-1,4-benzoquinol methylase